MVTPLEHRQKIIAQPKYVTFLNWCDSHIQPPRMQAKPSKHKLTISLGSTHSLATERGLQINGWRTSGMPSARMWALILSWDALPLLWFPGYQVLGNPPWFDKKENSWGQNLQPPFP
ncbi:hypothetical protein GOODEAATRI_022476 [Goodea atripinnis]|uniref:Uncharacterized protein n=1 Tax=Goodea atripinnis TaxID=208336 RepID=A0ABV0NMD4_9TELE